MKHYLSQNSPKIRCQLGADEHHLRNSVALRSNASPITHTFSPSKFYSMQEQKQYVPISSTISASRRDVSAELAYQKKINQKTLQKHLIEATNRQDIKEVQRLLFSTDLEDIKDIFALAVCAAIKHGNLNLVRLFSQKCGDPELFLEMWNHSEVPIQCAIRYHQRDIISFFTQIFIYPLGHSKDISGSNAALYRAINTENSIDLIDIAISQGAQINVRDQELAVPLHHAVVANRPEIVQLLLLYQANPNAQNNIGQTVLHLAAQMRNKEMMTILLQSSANPSIVDGTGLTAEEVYRARMIEAVDIRPNNIEQLQALFDDLANLSTNQNILHDLALYSPDIIQLD